MLFGILLTTKETLTLDYDEMVADRKSAGTAKFPHSDDPNKNIIHKKIEDDAKDIINSNILGFWLLALGTLIWSYGDIPAGWLLSKLY